MRHADQWRRVQKENNMTRALESKKIIVTGGSRGIGKAIVLKLAEQGAHVLFTYQSNEAAAKAVQAEAQAKGGAVMGIQVDITKLEDLKRLFEYVPSNFSGETDIYIGNAFPAAVFAPTAMMPEQGFDGMFAAVKGNYFALQQAAQHLNPGGKIIVFSSGAAAMPQFASGAYAGAKAAVERFALSLSKELGQQQITVNVVSPGVTETDGLVAPQEMIDALVAQTPLGRLGQPNDVANAVVQLCLPEMSWVNGQIIQVNGGIL
jgi:3-oxoacyl-[acyl-carrier protein] reductase